MALANCLASRRAVKTGFELVREGEATDSLYFLEVGWACQYTTTRDGRRQISALLLPGDVCDLDTILFGQFVSGVQMLTAGTVMSVPHERVAPLVATFPGIARAFTWSAFVENAILSRNALRLGRLSARERLSHLLCELAVRLGFRDDGGEISFDMPLTQEHLADALGLTPIHVNRTMQQLRTEGLLASTKRTIEICDVAALRRVGQFDPGYLHTPEPQVGAARDQRDGDRSRSTISLDGQR